MTPPTGTITFLFTDIEGSTKLWERCPDAMRLALARHDAILRGVIERNNGHVFKTVGDAFCAAFPTALDALNAALQSHLALLEQEWGETGPIRVRMGLHTGEAEERDNDYFGSTLNRAARLQGIGHGQQTLISQVTYKLIYDRLPDGVTLRSLGQHRLKDLLAPEHVWQLLHPSLPSEFAPLKSLNDFPTNLPQQMNSFIGREVEMKEVKRLLSSGRLLTLLGTGGAGKTRLALQVAADVLQNYKDGAWLVDLAPFADANVVPHAIANAFGLREENARPMLHTLLDFLKEKKLLLLLDNCDHLIAGCAVVAESLLINCADLSILATSREPLGIDGERRWRVPSLLGPDPDDLRADEQSLPKILMSYDAPRLFVERAGRHRQDFVLTHKDVFAVAHLCQQLDGIPLALELAAARAGSFSVQQISEKLDSSLRFLNSGSRTALPRHKTLRALIDWSYDLLSHEEKAMLARVSVFVGGWTLEAAQEVCVGENIEDWEILDLLASLVDKSLVMTEQDAEHTRYRLLETVRQFASEKLRNEDTMDQVRDRHQAHYLQIAENAELLLKGSGQRVWLDRLEADHANFRAALAWGEHQTRLRLAGALAGFWFLRGYFSEGRHYLSNLLHDEQSIIRGDVRAKALNGFGLLANYQADYDFARLSHEEALNLYETSGNLPGMAAALLYLGMDIRELDGDEPAEHLYNRSLELWRRLNDRSGLATTSTYLGNIARAKKDYDSARNLYENALHLSNETGNSQAKAEALNALSNLSSAEGDIPTAWDFCERALHLRKEIQDKWGTAASLNNLASLCRKKGDYLKATDLYTESLLLRRELGDQWGISNTLDNLGTVAAIQRDYARALSLFSKSLRIKHDVGDKHAIANILRRMASANASLDCPDTAIRLYAAASRICDALNLPQDKERQEALDNSLSDLRNVVGAPVFEICWTEGNKMDIEQAVAYAVQSAEKHENAIGEASTFG